MLLLELDELLLPVEVGVVRELEEEVELLVLPVVNSVIVLVVAILVYPVPKVPLRLIVEEPFSVMFPDEFVVKEREVVPCVFVPFALELLVLEEL